MSANMSIWLAEFRPIYHIAQGMQQAGLPRHWIERSITRLVGAKLRAMAQQAEAHCGHKLPKTSHDECTGDPSL